MSAPLIDVGDLIEFIDELRLAGYDISTQQYIGAQNLLLALAANGHLPSDPRALQTWLAPVLCSSPREQNNFYRRFDRWIAQHPRFAQAKATKKELDKEQAITAEAETRGWRSTLLQPKYLVPLLIVLVIVAGLVFVPPLIPRTLTGQVVDDDSKQPLANTKISLGEKTAVSDSRGGFSISYRPKQLPDTLIAEYPEYETATLTIDANSQSPLVVNLQQVPPPPDDTSTPVPAAATFPDDPVVVANPQPTITPMPVVAGNTAKWVRLGGAILPFFVFGVWLLWEKKLSNALLKKLRSATQPHLDQIVVKGAAGQLFLGQSFRRTIQELRRHRQRGARELDAPGTVHRTIEKGGLFSPFYGLRQTLPEYLVLIDRASFQDQQARLEEELIRRLVQENVFVDSYYFQGDPRTCRTPGKDTRFVTLQELAALHPDHHLIIFSDGSTFLNPVSGAPESWLEMFSPWAKRALLTPEPAAQWGYREWVLAELDFIVLPATKEGLAALTELIDGGTSILLDRSQRARPFPPMLRERPRRWLDNHEPPPEIANQLCDQLKLFLGSKGYFWLSACSIYPILYWDLTLYLGFKLFSDRAEIEERLLSLVRLPWFRYGTLPDWLRTRLSSDLTQEDNLRIRRILEELFLTVLQKPSEGIRLDIASGKGESRLKRWLTSWKFKRFLRHALKEEPPEGPLRDYVFLAFMSGRKPRKLTVSVPDSIRRVFFPQGQFALGMRPLSALVLAALLSLSMFSLVPTQAGRPSPGGGPTPSPSPTSLHLYAEMSDEEKNGFIRQTAQEISEKLGPGSDNITDEGMLRIKNEVDNYARRIGSNSPSQWDEDLGTVLTRGSQFAPRINQAFSERKVPPIVGLYIAMVFTEFTNKTEETMEGASGIFLLTRATAQSFGTLAAERSDISKSAQAAAKYVASSMNTLGSDSARMPLVILSYKRGVTKVAQDVRLLSGSPSFWNLVTNAKQLDQQFQDEDIRYVPRFFAAAIIGENPQNFGIEQLAPLSAYKPGESVSIEQQLADLIAEFSGDERRSASDQLDQLYGQNKAAVVKLLIDAIKDQGPDSYRVNLYIARTLGSIRPNWEGTAEQLARVEALKGSNDYQDATFKGWVDKAIGNFTSIGSTQTTPTPTPQPSPSPGVPRFAFTVSPTRAVVNQPVRFTVNVTPRTTAYYYTINFGDGSPSVGSGGRIIHSYKAAGTYRVTAVATPTDSAIPEISKSATMVVTEGVTVPNLIGMSQDSAQKVATGDMLSIGKVTQRETSDRPEGVVISQSLKAGALVARYTRIDIVVARKDESSTSAEQSLVIVPDVVGRDADTAEAILNKAGLKTSLVRRQGRLLVMEQYPKPGTKVPRGTVLKLRTSSLER